MYFPQDFHFRLDNLLRTLVHAKPHFIRCVRPNETESSSEFDRSLVSDSFESFDPVTSLYSDFSGTYLHFFISQVIQQVRSLQVLETVNLMAGGFPHRYFDFFV